MKFSGHLWDNVSILMWILQLQYEENGLCLLMIILKYWTMSGYWRNGWAYIFTNFLHSYVLKKWWNTSRWVHILLQETHEAALWICFIHAAPQSKDTVVLMYYFIQGSKCISCKNDEIWYWLKITNTFVLIYKYMTRIDEHQI